LYFQPVQAAEPVFPLRIAARSTFLEDQAGVSFLIRGDSPWSLMTAITDEEVAVYLDDRKKKGFNSVLVNLIEHYFNGPANRDGETPFTTEGDFLAPNEAYFAHVDGVIRAAEQRGINVFLAPAYLGYECGEQGWCAEVARAGPARMYRYGVWLGTRYRWFPNIVWVAGGDADARRKFGTRYSQDALMRGIRAVDSEHLMTAHCDRRHSAIDCYRQRWLDLNTTYSECEHVAADLARDYKRGGAQPFFFIEGSYEGDRSAEWCGRLQAYGAVLSGAAGYFYGNDPVWRFDSGWRQALDAPGASSLAHLAALFESRAWTEFEPDLAQRVVATVGEIGAIGGRAMAAVSAAGDSVIVYVPPRVSVEIDTTKLVGSSFRAWWIDASSGEVEPARVLDSGPAVAAMPPREADWVLVVDSESADYSPPRTARVLGAARE
jgi:hypothetical protein